MTKTMTTMVMIIETLSREIPARLEIKFHLVMQVLCISPLASLIFLIIDIHLYIILPVDESCI